MQGGPTEPDACPHRHLEHLDLIGSGMGREVQAGDGTQQTAAVNSILLRCPWAPSVHQCAEQGRVRAPHSIHTCKGRRAIRMPGVGRRLRMVEASPCAALVPVLDAAGRDDDERLRPGTGPQMRGPPVHLPNVAHKPMAESVVLPFAMQSNHQIRW